MVQDVGRLRSFDISVDIQRGAGLKRFRVHRWTSDVDDGGGDSDEADGDDEGLSLRSENQGPGAGGGAS